ncbi:hypothetical protein [uncultured Methanobacterium sp.]|uniref:hypothetical protein n=1 Tax=uncultured Methanobacterium sp. TaxID=176306 RepID=UPI002AA82259|nr:hypothetical protein [uncultured Methanobacterium sp.]
MLKVKDKIPLALGLLAGIWFVLVYLISQTQLDLAGIYLICIAIFFTLDGILDNKSGILNILLGVTLLISDLIMLLIQKDSLTSFNSIIFIILALFFLTIGIGLYLGFLPVKKFKSWYELRK